MRHSNRYSVNYNLTPTNYLPTVRTRANNNTNDKQEESIEMEEEEDESQGQVLSEVNPEGKPERYIDFLPWGLNASF